MLKIVEDNLTGAEIQQFLSDHLDDMHSISPPDSVHALDLNGLRAPEVTFWTAWAEGRLLGCGALKLMDDHSAEIKSMRTAPAHRGKGVARLILEHIIDQAITRGVTRLFLETGSQPEFQPARSLYSRYGFEFRGPFGVYTEDPNSVFMTRALPSG